MSTRTALSKTKVNDKAMDVRRSADKVRHLVNSVNTARRPGESLEQALDRFDVRDFLSEKIGEIEGFAAQLREMLEVD